MLQRGRNDDGLLDLVDYAREHGHVLRVIEFMDVGTTNGWQGEQVVTAAEVLERVGAVHPLVPVDEPRDGQVAERWRYVDGRGELGLVSSVTRPFCGDCVRARLTATGELHTCLFSAAGHDLRTPLREGATEDEVLALVQGLWRVRDDRYSELRGQRHAAAAAQAGDELPRRLSRRTGPHRAVTRPRSLACPPPRASGRSSAPRTTTPVPRRRPPARPPGEPVTLTRTACAPPWPHCR